MKEQFDNRLLRGNIKIKCKNEDGTFRMWETLKEEVVQHIINIVEEFNAMGYTLTLRQLHYQLVSNNWIINHQTAYKKLGSILDDCRYAGVIDWKHIEDRGRVSKLTYWVHDIADALNTTVESYRLNLQEGQENAIELWTEKDALSGILGRSTDKYHIRLVVNKGYTSSSAIYDAYQRVVRNWNNMQRTIILYFGDHDPSGLDMIRDINERLSFMLRNGRLESEYPEELFEVIQVGLNMRQIKKYNLPPNPTKMTDSRSDGYVKIYGNTCWEVDALRPEVLTSLVENRIEDFMDMSLYNDRLEEQANDIAKRKEFINKNK